MLTTPAYDTEAEGAQPPWRTEYLEWPDLVLTPSQVAALLDLDGVTAAAVLHTLEDSRFLIYRKFKNSFPGALRPKSSIVSAGARCRVQPSPRSDASWDDLRRVRSLPQCAGRATRPGFL